MGRGHNNARCSGKTLCNANYNTANIEAAEVYFHHTTTITVWNLMDVSAPRPPLNQPLKVSE